VEGIQCLLPCFGKLDDWKRRESINVLIHVTLNQ
jgi:hypothetical protein